MNSSPKYDTNEVVYFRASAARGFIEAVKISAITKITTTWLYAITYRNQLPQAPTIYGDRINFNGAINPEQVYYTEDEFVTYCKALGLAQNYLQNQLDSINQLIATNCGTSVTG